MVFGRKLLSQPSYIRGLLVQDTDRGSDTLPSIQNMALFVNWIPVQPMQHGNPFQQNQTFFRIEAFRNFLSVRQKPHAFSTFADISGMARYLHKVRRYANRMIRHLALGDCTMATITSASTPSRTQMNWIPVLVGIAIICGESTNTMGARHTGLWLNQLVTWAGHADGPVALLNHILRKSGHFMGYGLLGVFFARGWFSLLRRKMVAGWSSLRLRAGALAILSTAVVASADEIHQMFLPTRGASVEDVLLDTSGAVVLNILFFAVLAVRRNSLLNPQTPYTTLGLSMAELPARISNSREVRVLKTKSVRGLATLRRGVQAKRTWSAPDFIASRRTR